MMSKNKKLEVISGHSCLLGEGPVWDDKRNVICWVDILNGVIYEYAPGSDTSREIRVGQMIGSFAVCTNGNFIAALQNGFAFVNNLTGELSMINDPETDLPGNRFNEGKCDPAGRFWAGTMSLSSHPAAGSVYTLDSNLSVTKKIDQVSISNGMAWSSDHQTFFFIDTPLFEVAAYDYDKFTGQISNKRTIIKIPVADGYPDGMTIDTDGMLWIAHWDGWQVTRWDPLTGAKLHTIKLPVSKVTSCTFGGENYTDLYITSAKVELSEEELGKQPLAGSLFVLRDCGFQGSPAFKFDAS